MATGRLGLIIGFCGRWSVAGRPKVIESDEIRMTLGEHLDELRRRLFYALLGPLVGFVVCFGFFRDELLNMILRPVTPHWELFGYAIPGIEVMDIPFTVRTPYAAFTTSMFISLIAGLIATAPWSFYHLWAFVGAGLRPQERRWVRVFAPFSLVLFAAGAAFFYFVVYPVVISFFYGFGREFNSRVGRQAITDFTDLNGYVSFVMVLILVFGLMFELPLVVYFLGKTRLVSALTFRRVRRQVILGIVILSAIVTPPDIFSQISLSLPMILLYELGIVMVAASERSRARSAG